MSQTISKGRIFSVAVEVDDDRLAQMKKAPELTQKAMQHGADFWHGKIFPGHFDPPAHGKYGYADRSFKYRKSKHGIPDLVKTGSMKRDLTSAARYRLMGSGATLEMKMWARVLNFSPVAAGGENSQDLYAPMKPKKRGGGPRAPYPNMRRELKIVLEDEREAIAVEMANKLEESFGPTGATTKIGASNGTSATI